MSIIIYIAVIVVIPVIAAILRANLEPATAGGSISLIPDVFWLDNSQNRGVAFGLFQNSTVFFAIVTSIVILVFGFLLIKNYKKSKLFSTAAALIIGGGIANLIERVAFGYVFDYLKLSFFPPVCNFADYCITAGTICLVVYLLFFSDLLKSKKEKEKKAAKVEKNGSD